MSRNQEFRLVIYRLRKMWVSLVKPRRHETSTVPAVLVGLRLHLAPLMLALRAFLISCFLEELIT